MHGKHLVRVQLPVAAPKEVIELILRSRRTIKDSRTVVRIPVGSYSVYPNDRRLAYHKESATFYYNGIPLSPIERDLRLLHINRSVPWDPKCVKADVLAAIDARRDAP